MSWYGFLWIYPIWDLFYFILFESVGLISFVKFGEILAIIYLIIFFSWIVFLLTSRTLMIQKLDFLLSSIDLSNHFFSSLISLYCLHWVISNYLSLSLRIHSLLFQTTFEAICWVFQLLYFFRFIIFSSLFIQYLIFLYLDFLFCFKSVFNCSFNNFLPLSLAKRLRGNHLIISANFVYIWNFTIKRENKCNFSDLEKMLTTFFICRKNQNKKEMRLNDYRREYKHFN